MLRNKPTEFSNYEKQNNYVHFLLQMPFAIQQERIEPTIYGLFGCL